MPYTLGQRRGDDLLLHLAVEQHAGLRRPAATRVWISGSWSARLHQRGVQRAESPPRSRRTTVSRLGRAKWALARPSGEPSGETDLVADADLGQPPRPAAMLTAPVEAGSRRLTGRADHVHGGDLATIAGPIAAVGSRR